jgi:large subunit ribosomal protein L35
MPKMKTHRGAAKRFKRLKSGKIKTSHAMANHILTKKSPARKRKLRAGIYVSDVDKKRFDTLLPNS